MTRYYIADLRPEWRSKRYVTFWRPNDAGYAFPLSWSGQYAQADLIAAVNYYWAREGQSLIRFPVPCAIVDRRAVPPAPGVIDGDAGPVLPNNGTTRKWLRRQAFIPECLFTSYDVSTGRFPDARPYRAKSPAAARWADYRQAREAGYYSDGFWAYLADAPLVTETKSGRVSR